jgi:3',5'-cyclic-AMP phosphodiesterase
MLHSSDRRPIQLRVLQLTDIHLFASAEQSLMGIKTHESLIPILEAIIQLQPAPDLFLLTGDLSQDGTPESYAQLVDLLSPLSRPIYWLPGNHDCFETMARSLNHPPFVSDKSFTQQGWQFLLLNSQIPGDVPGYLQPATLDWLKSELNALPDVPTTIAFHHPPLTLNAEWLDSSALQNSDDLFQVLDEFPQVKLVLFGHIHQEVEQLRSGVTYLGCPSTCFQFARDHSQFALDHDRFPGFRILDLNADGTWTTEVKRVDCHMRADETMDGY